MKVPAHFMLANPKGVKVYQIDTSSKEYIEMPDMLKIRYYGNRNKLIREVEDKALPKIWDIVEFDSNVGEWFLDMYVTGGRI